MAVESDSEAAGEYECELCGETFESEAALRAHVRSVGIVD
jgi:hypothetical protein